MRQPCDLLWRQMTSRCDGTRCHAAMISCINGVGQYPQAVARGGLQSSGGGGDAPRARRRQAGGYCPVRWLQSTASGAAASVGNGSAEWRSGPARAGDAGAREAAFQCKVSVLAFSPISMPGRHGNPHAPIDNRQIRGPRFPVSTSTNTTFARLKSSGIGEARS